jgi:transcriptional regulator with XRE-family HTH domain
MTPARFRSLRERLGLSHPQLGRGLGVESKTISRWENGHSTVPPATAILMEMLAEAVTRYPLTLADCSEPAPPHDSTTDVATEAIASLLRKAGVKVEILDH